MMVCSDLFVLLLTEMIPTRIGKFRTLNSNICRVYGIKTLCDCTFLLKETMQGLRNSSNAMISQSFLFANYLELFDKCKMECFWTNTFM